MNTDLKIVAQRLKATMQTLPYKVGVLMVAFTKERFRQQNWIGDSVEPWPSRKKKTKWGRTKRNNGRALLVNSGRLRRATRIISTTPNSVTIGNDTPYAAVHNEGYKGWQIQQVKPFKRRRFGMVKSGTGRFSKKTGKEGMRTKRTATGEINVKGHERRIIQNIPSRRFMGNSRYLNMQISRLIGAEINKTFKP